MSALSPEARKLLAARRRSAPTSAQRVAIKRAVLGGAVLVPGAAAAASSGGLAAAKATGAMAFAKLGLAVVSIAVGASVTWQLTSPPPRAAAIDVRPSSPAKPAAPARTEEPAERLDEPEPVAERTPPPLAPQRQKPIPPPVIVPAAPTAPAVRPNKPPEDPSLTREVTAISRAMGAVSSKQYDKALDDVAAYRTAFPAGALATEASVLEVLALCGLGRVDEARAASQSLPPQNPAVKRLEHSCVEKTRWIAKPPATQEH